MLQASGRTQLGRNQQRIFLHHLVGSWMKTEQLHQMV